MVSRVILSLQEQQYMYIQLTTVLIIRVIKVGWIFEGVPTDFPIGNA